MRISRELGIPKGRSPHPELRLLIADIFQRVSERICRILLRHVEPQESFEPLLTVVIRAEVQESRRIYKDLSRTQAEQVRRLLTIERKLGRPVTQQDLEELYGLSRKAAQEHLLSLARWRDPKIQTSHEDDE